MYLEYKKISGEIHLDIDSTDTQVAQSTSQNQASTINKDGHQLTSEDRKLLDKLQKKAEKLNSTEEIDEVSPNERNIAEIQRVPKSAFRDVKVQESFRPIELPIGPIFADDPNLDKKEFKLQLAAYYIGDDSGAAVLEEIKKNIKDMKKCFDEEVLTRYSDDEELARLLFLDGCAMLGFILGYMWQTLNEVNISNEQAALINRDLFSPENQIPFTVLEALMKENGLSIMFHLARFVCLMNNIAFPGYYATAMRVFDYVYDCCFSSKMKGQKPLHILDLLRYVYLIEYNSVFGDMGTRICNICNSCCCGSVALVRHMVRFFNQSDSDRNIRRNSVPFCTVQELKTAGIKFKPVYSLKTISFHSRLFIRPKLLLPILVLDESTERTLLNLVAYEKCFSESRKTKKLWVTSYVKLLDLLIGSEEDFKDLKVAGILRNYFESDTAAFQLIKSIGSKCFPFPPDKKDVFAGMKNEINNYCRTRCAIWMAEVRNAHFRNPCTALAVLAATLVLVLTAVQTWYAINPKK